MIMPASGFAELSGLSPHRVHRHLFKGAKTTTLQ
jgi:hypothetical protein